ncbi:AMP-dependent synthetase/ligase [Chondromyces apiculatus]|uniref:Long-chain-fatty-acid--CoA ligase n=1 Tax=Chondromyces apiculatus DSM 436 TaxID=1192034 RepID=A0A017SWV6_9BACT|nr:AMP-dependent synthetase/ligase [Chondromyces apiculatus]EYF01449.1 Long-chain-fatty-acid--CoA ligase [Chondromyces apiculatus DSM 436]
MPSDTIPRRLFARAKERPEAPAYLVRESGSWKATPWRQYAAEVMRAGKALMAMGLEVGSTVSILGFNRPEWVILDVAAMAIGGAPAGVYSTSSAEELKYIVHHAESKVLLVENAQQLGKALKVWGELPLLAHVVLMRGTEASGDPRVLTWDDFLTRGAEVTDEAFFARLDAVEPGALATLIYTSGTTGPPKGVMLSHRNLTWTADVARRLIDLTPWDCSLSYLPLSHIAEQVFTIHGPITAGSSVYFAESIEKMAENLREVQPTIFFGVPRVWEKLHAGVSAKLGEAKGLKRAIAAQAMAAGRAYHDVLNRDEIPNPLLTVKHRLFERLVYGKVKQAVGFGRARVCVSGAAPIGVEVLDFFAGLDLPIREVYGQSEDTGPTSFNLPGRSRFGSVGPAFPGLDVRIAEDGEIQVKGPNVFLGYYKDPEGTAETLLEGWLCTGDLGKFDQDGFLHITGRKKDIIITAGGKNITPQNIEVGLKRHPLVAEAVVIGDRRRYLTAIIVLNPEAAQQLATERGLSGPLHENPEIRREVQRAVDEVNAQFAQVETVKRFTIASRSFGIDTGELTPTLKVKRRNVVENFAREIDAMYAE